MEPNTDGNGGIKREAGWWARVKRIVRYRLHIPMIRSPHPPEYTARGVMVGTIWALIPIFGLQMAAVLLTWLILEKWLKWEFSLVNGLAWTWTTNIVTIIPTYYVYYVTGQLAIGRYDDISGYSRFRQLFETAQGVDISFWERLVIWMQTLIGGWGLPILVGSIPWTILLGWLAYVLSLRFCKEYQRRRAIRLENARNRGGQPPP